MCESTANEVASVYTVVGMTCEHCVRSVTEEITAVPGVRDVRVDLTSGQITVNSTEPIAEADVDAAVQQAGYRLGAQS